METYETMKRLWMILWIAAMAFVAACSAGAGGGASHGAHHGGEADASGGGASHGGVHGAGDGHDGHSHGAEGEDSGAAAGLQASFAFPNGAPEAGQRTTLELRISREDGSVVTAYDVSHEKLMHLIAVSEDLSFFAHLHPELEDDGRFTVEAEFPKGGRYKLFADFVPTGAWPVTIGQWIDVAGDVRDETPPADEELVKTVDGKEVALDISPFAAQTDAALTFTIRDAATGEPIADLEPYLGAVGHVVIVSEDAESYLHVHPDDASGSGPEAAFHTSFPSGGTYRIWGQFQHEGNVFTVPYTVNVP